MGKSITPRTTARPLPPDFTAACAADGFVSLTIDTDESWTFDAVTFKASKTGGADRGYAERIRRALADKCNVPKAEVSVSTKRDKDTVVAVAWRRTPKADDTDDADTDDTATDDTDDDA